MKTIQRFLVCLLIFSIIPIVSIKASTLLDRVYYTPSVDLGVSLKQFDARNCLVTVENGKEILYSVAGGSQSILHVYNITDQKIIDMVNVPGKVCWSHAVDSQGTVYMTLDGYVCRYYPGEKRLEELGRVPNNTSSYSICFDETDTPYVGVYPEGKIIKFNLVTKQFETVFTFGSEYPYVRSLVYHNGYIYATTFSENGFIVKINVNNTNDYTYLNLPISSGEALTDAFLTLVDDYLIINATLSNSKPLWVFHTTTGAFVQHNYEGSFRGLHSTSSLNGKIYFTSNDGTFYSFDLNTYQAVNLNFKMLDNSQLNGGGFVSIPNDPINFPNQSYITVASGVQNPVIINFQTRKIRELTEAEFQGTAASFQTIKSCFNNGIALGGFASSHAGYYDIDSGKLNVFDSRQIHTAHGFDGKVYYGGYSGAIIQEYDPSLPIDNVTNPKIARVIGEEQNRPFGMSSGDGKLFMGSVPYYYKLGGALTIYDKQANTWETYRNIVQNQSIIATAYQNGIVYGTTSIFGGLGSTPVETQAKIFIWDVANKKVVKEFSPDLGLNYPITAFGKILVGPDQKIWVGAANLLFSFDPVTFEIDHLMQFASPYEADVVNWYPVFMEFSSDGLLYFWVHKNTDITENALYVIDPETMEYKNISNFANRPKYCKDMTIGGDGNIYYSSDSTLCMIGVFDCEFQISDINTSLSNLNEYQGFFIGEPYAVLNGRVVKINKETLKDKPILQDGNAYIPAYFIEENYFEKIEYNTNELKINGERVSFITIDNIPYLKMQDVADAMGKSYYSDSSGLIVFGESTFNKTQSEIKKIQITMENYLQYSYLTAQNTEPVIDAPTILSMNYDDPTDVYKISWNEISGATKYAVEVKDGDNRLFTDTITENQFDLGIDHVLIDGTKIYTVTVTALNQEYTSKKASIDVDTRYAGGTGTASLPFCISNARQFYNITLNNDQEFSQLKDIEEVITKPVEEFKGKYFGNNKTLTVNLNSSSGIGLFTTANNATIDGIILKGNVVGIQNVGGIAGNATGKCEIRNCINEAKIQGKNRVGGIVGNFYDSVTEDSIIEKSINKGFIKATGSYSGGIVGLASKNVQVIKTANIEAVEGSTGVGGISGTTYGIINQSYNMGNISAIAEASFAGGISGGLRYGNATNAILNCYNLGVITATGQSAGIALCAISGGGVKIQNCYQVGEAEHPIGYNKYSDSIYAIENCYFLSSSDEEYPISGIEAVPLENLPSINLGDAFMVDSTSAIYIYPQIIGNLQIKEYNINQLAKMPDSISYESYPFVPVSFTSPVEIGSALINTPYFIAASKVDSVFGYSLTDYGMLFSKTNPIPQIDTADCKKISADVLKTVSGRFGILFYGSGLKIGNSYFVRAYAIYEDSASNKTIIYGNIINCTI